MRNARDIRNEVVPVRVKFFHTQMKTGLMTQQDAAANARCLNQEFSGLLNQDILTVGQVLCEWENKRV